MKEVNVVKVPDTLISKITTNHQTKNYLIKEETLQRLRAFFKSKGLSPSPEMWEGIEDLVVCLERMADGTAGRDFYLSALDPGVGKTQTVFQFLLSLLASPEHHHVGVVVFMFTKEEIRTFVAAALEAGLPNEAFAARVHKDDVEVNSLGCGDPEKARILFTTHQRLVTICNERRFEDIRDFCYQGYPRQVRVWDEALLPARRVLLDRLEIAGLYPDLRGNAELVDDLDLLRGCLKEAKDRSFIEVPDLAKKHGLSITELQRHLRDKPGDVQDAAADLWHVLGKKAVVRRDGNAEPRIVSFRPNLPDDLAPIVILDASGRVAATYSWWERRRGSLVRLKPGIKRYDNLTLHVWSTGGGASSFTQEKLAVRRSAIVETIKLKPTEPWLVVCHKAHETQLMREIQADLYGTGITVHSTHWGLHRATNKYRDICNVILAGTQFLPRSVDEATGRAAGGLTADDGLLTEAEERELLIGHQTDVVLQAICRGSARCTVDGHCGRCDAYIIVHPRHGVIEHLEQVFPGCRVVDWMPVRKPPSGKVAQALEYVLQRLQAEPDKVLSFQEVYEAIGMDRSNFGKLRLHQDFLAGIEAPGIETDRPRYARGFQYADEEPLQDGQFEDYFPPVDDTEEA